MLKALAAVVAAAVGAAMMVALIPPPEAANAARTPLPGGADLRKPVCTQSWPYYEQSCLSDARRPNGNARPVRVVASAIPSGKRTVHARH